MSTNGYGDRQWNAWYGAMYYEDIMKYVQVCTCATSQVFTEPFWVKTMEYLTPRNFLPIKISGFCKIFWKPKIYATINTPSLFHTHYTNRSGLEGISYFERLLHSIALAHTGPNLSQFRIYLSWIDNSYYVRSAYTVT